MTITAKHSVNKKSVAKTMGRKFTVNVPTISSVNLIFHYKEELHIMSGLYDPINVVCTIH